MVRHPHAPSTAGKRGRSAEVLARADAALRMGNTAEAQLLAESILKADKSDLIASTILARALMALNRHKEAIPVLERVAERNADPATRTLLAIALAGAGRADDALMQLKHVTDGNTAFPRAFREHASQLAKRGHVDDAIALATRGIALSPESIELRMDLAALHLRRNDRTAARDILIEAREAAPGRPDILVELARVMLLDGEYAEAAGTYRHALALQPDNAMTRSNLAACQLEMGQRDAGEASLRSVMKGRPEMMGRAIYALAASSHGRFFLRPSRVAKFLRGEL